MGFILDKVNFKQVEEFKYLRAIVTRFNNNYTEQPVGVWVGNACFHSVG